MQTEDFYLLSPIHRWWLAIRPKTLPAAAAPVVLGWGISSTTGNIFWPMALAALLSALMIQIGTNLVNDVIDFSKGADTIERTGPIRVTQAGLITTKQVWTGVWVSFGLAAMAGIYLMINAGWVIGLIGFVSILAGIGYTAGPYPLAYLGLGDLFVFIFFGFVAVCGTVYVSSGDLPILAWYGAAAAGALTVNILVVNNIRDIATDRVAGRKNIAIVFGRTAAIWEYTLMLLIAYLVPGIVVWKALASPWVLLTYLSLPQGIRLLNILRGDLPGHALNPILGKTANLLLSYSLLFAAGLVVSFYLL